MQDFAFIFDMDGVIVDSNPYHKISLQQFVARHGYELTDDQLKEKIYGRTNMDWISGLFGSMSKVRLLELEEEKESLFRDLYKKDMKPVKGLISFLQQLDKNQIPRAIGTSAPPSNVDFTLDGTDTRKFFSLIRDETHITNGKPNPEIYLKVVEALGLPAKRCMVIEDSLSGIEAGLAADCKVIGITTTHTPEELKRADFVIHDFTDLDPLWLKEKLLG